MAFKQRYRTEKDALVGEGSFCTAARMRRKTPARLPRPLQSVAMKEAEGSRTCVRAPGMQTHALEFSTLTIIIVTIIVITTTITMTMTMTITGTSTITIAIAITIATTTTTTTTTITTTIRG